MVAGQIANLLSYDKVPFDTSSGNLVTNARDYIKSNPAAGWERRDHARVLWNGVTEADNARYKTCTDIMANKYVARETLRSAIEDDFCNKNLNAPVSIRYHEGSMEDVTVHLEYYHDNPDPSVLTQASCRQNLLEITDGCSIPDVHDNPLNFKAGGVASLGGATYRIEPQSLRQPASRAYDQDGNGCNCVYKFWYDDFTVWGHGWISEDFGVAFREKLKAKCSLNGQTWTFNYGLGDDGREWTAWFRTTVFQSSCVSGVAKEFGANEDFNCNSG
ncbi:hypothetical protein CONLIGDRAFT_634211 [Coniochaeta ligniaria NRRL 30616]|uniref:Uncharacterized protein n=1 Tax=Coniochaeta ligniaria NRRL 30616 TaxID=1408157 RepID=A0A1J7IKF5_9PEZI|nr:hypothetical protein CONLIGDRAFT_634211 [Coniochaeta ligniaria NRRL 30616]